MTLKQVAKRTAETGHHVSAKTIERIEKGKTHPVERAILGISAALDMEGDWLVEALKPPAQRKHKNTTTLMAVNLEMHFDEALPQELLNAAIEEGKEAMVRTISERTGANLSNIHAIVKKSIEITFIVSVTDALRIASAFSDGRLADLPIKSISFPRVPHIDVTDDPSRSSGVYTPKRSQRNTTRRTHPRPLPGEGRPPQV